MQLPPPLRRAIDAELAACDGAPLRAAAARLSQCYRQASARGRSDVSHRVPVCEASGVSAAGALAGELERAAYLGVRMPATFAAVAAALRWTREAWSEQHRVEGPGQEESAALDIRSMLDLGSGPGTALWAAAQVIPTLASATAVERDPQQIEMGRRLAAHSEEAAVREAAWLRGDLTTELPSGRWDLVVCSYALNEIGEAQRAELMRQAWARCAKLLVVIEPGTRAGFANVLAVRGGLLAAGANLAAPCPHSLACPMAGGDDWCHFAARVERTASHRRLKDATLGHEDEKFSYVAFMREAPGGTGQLTALRPQAPARIVRHPRILSGYAQLTLCREDGIQTTTVTRSQKDDWRRLKRLGWGDRW